MEILCYNLPSFAPAKDRRTLALLVACIKSLWITVILWTAWRALQESNLWPQD